MKLNGQQYKIYGTETTGTLISRIAADFDTLPEWLMFIPPTLPKTLEEWKKADLKVSDYLVRVRGQTSLTIPSPPFPESLTEEQVQDVFISSNKFLEANPDMVSLVLSPLRGKLHKDPETIWRNRTSLIGHLDKKIRTNKTNSALLTRQAEKLEKIPLLEYTPYIIDRVEFTVDFGPYNGTLLDLFNATTLNRNVPYIACTLGTRQMYKVYRGFQINPEWLTLRLTNVILLKINTEELYRETSGVNKYQSFTSAALTVTEEGRLLGTLDAVVGGDKHVTKQEFTERVVRVLPPITSMRIVRDDLIMSHFAFPRQCFDPTVFADMIMLNDTVNAFVVIDEFARASRISNNSTYVKQLNGSSASSLLLKQTTYAGSFGMKSAGEWYVMCRMRTKSEEEAREMQHLLARLLSLYNDERSRISNEYSAKLGKLYTPNTCTGISTKRLTRTKGLKGLRAIEPEIFFPTYTRMCTNPPIVVDDFREATNQVMEFPIKGEVGSDGVPIKPRLYTCDLPTHKYIGLRENDRPNKDLFPYVPCCFARDQITKEGSAYRAYHFGEESGKSVRKKEEPIDDAVETLIRRVGPVVNNVPPVAVEQLDVNYQPGQTLELPALLAKFFDTITLDPMKKYERRTVRHNRASAIEAILYARGAIKYKKMRLTTVNNKIGVEVAKLTNIANNYAIAVKQELYDSDIEEIKAALATKFLLPSIFVHALEVLLDCNIFVFNANGLIVPRHSRMYVKFKPSREVFFLYESPNKTVDIIGVRDAFGPPESFNATFGPAENVTKRVYETFRKMTISYANMLEIPVPKLSRMNITSQLIDSHGKCRAIVVADSMTLVPSTPLPPFTAPIATALPRASLAAISNIKNHIVHERRVIGATTREVILTVGTVVMTFLTNDTAKTDIPISKETPKYDSLEAVNAVVAYRNLKTKASSLLQSAINETLTLMRSGKSLDNSLRIYANKHGGLTDDIKRLLYACGQWIRTHAIGATGNVTLTHTRNLTANTPSTYVLDGEDAINNLIHTYSYDHTHTHTEMLDTELPYFFENSNNVYLAVPVQSIEVCDKIVDAWMRTGRIREEDKLPTQRKTSIYAFTDSSKALIKISDGDVDNVCKILLDVNHSGRIHVLIR